MLRIGEEIRTRIKTVYPLLHGRKDGIADRDCVSRGRLQLFREHTSRGGLFIKILSFIVGALKMADHVVCEMMGL